MSIEINDNTLMGFICLCIAVITIVIWRYNTTSVIQYITHDYEEVSDIGSNKVYWRKAK